MLLDDVLPRWRFHEKHRLRMDLPVDAVLRSAEEVTWGEVPLMRALMTIRVLGGTTFERDRRILSMFDGFGWAVLARSDDEFVVGGILPTVRNAQPVQVAEGNLNALRNRTEAGACLVAVNFRFADGRLTTETRVEPTDARSQRLFRAYWTAIRLPSGLIRHEWLRAIRRRAARAAQRGEDAPAEQGNQAQRRP